MKKPVKLHSKIILLFFIFITSGYCQEKGIILMKKDSSSTVFLKENKRIKVKLLNSDVFVGRLKIESDSTFSIRGNTISLDSIAKIKRRSVVSTICSPLIVYFGAGIFGAGVLIAAIEELHGVGFLLTGIGGSMILIPIISNGHRPDKWRYGIGENPKQKNPQ